MRSLSSCVLSLTLLATTNLVVTPSAWADEGPVRVALRVEGSAQLAAEQHLSVFYERLLDGGQIEVAGGLEMEAVYADCAESIGISPEEARACALRAARREFVDDVLVIRATDVGLVLEVWSPDRNALVAVTSASEGELELALAELADGYRCSKVECGSAADAVAAKVTIATPTESDQTHPALRDCAQFRRFEPGEPAGFGKRRYQVALADKVPLHAASDVIAAPGQSAAIEVHFRYGQAGKDLEEERVSLHLDDCERWLEIAEALTDDDGRARFEIAADEGSRPGRHRLAAVVAGDASFAFAELWYLEPGRRVRLIDLDGTIVPNEALSPSDLVNPEPPAPELIAMVTDWVQAGDVVIYVTERPLWSSRTTRDYLARHGLEPGPLLLMADVDESDLADLEERSAWTRQVVVALTRLDLDLVSGVSASPRVRNVFDAAGIPTASPEEVTGTN